VLSIRGLTVEFTTAAGALRAVDGVDLEIQPGETLGVVGESGSGKTVTAMSILRLVPPPGRIVGGEVLFEQRNLLAMSERQLRDVRGKDIGVIFQDPTAYLNPVRTVGDQIGEALRAHDSRLSRQAARDRASTLLADVGVPSPQVRARQYPHEFSGGMRQRVLIAIATANRPRLLIADEPTTALDVTVQAEILEAIQSFQRESGASSLFVTHDLGVIAEIADRVVVMYAGRVVEQADVDSLFYHPRHPYTAALLAGVPQLDRRDNRRLTPIAGSPPTLADMPSGCPFHPRCSVSGGRSLCSEEMPDLREHAGGSRAACHFSDETPASALLGAQ
jgi:oligopeptide/dipeptide ABC transporter ATP-binding protein